jgi:hypothetical protein
MVDATAEMAVFARSCRGGPGERRALGIKGRALASGNAPERPATVHTGTIG